MQATTHKFLVAWRLPKMYEDRGFGVSVIPLTGDSVFEKISTHSTTGDWTALFGNGCMEQNPEQVPMVEEFKRLIS